ncbi:MAG: ATP-dependent helicase HrpB [Sandaracinaceae bacterium]
MALVPLPIDGHRASLLRAAEGGALVLVAEPGAGKTTRVPPMLLDSGLAHGGRIVVVQPRRIAARMAAARIANERGGRLGGEVGYRVRFDAKVGRQTRIELVTEGILARRLIADPTLEGVSWVVFDELHERHLDSDLSLARAERLRRTRRPDLGIVAMSATLDAGPVAEFLRAPALEVEGRTFPIEIRHDDHPDDRPLERRVRAAVVRLLEAGCDGDVLVFLPGAGEIRRAMEACEGPAEAFSVECVPLHGDLAADQQDRALRAGPRRKVIFATNIAETSLTIPTVVAVVDSGLVRTATVSPWSGLSRLDTVPISQASATQRAGRAGRTQAGVCHRLFTEADFRRRPERDLPEVQRADLTATVLSIRAEGETPASFPWFERPPNSALEAADVLLEKLGALSEDITPLGRAMLSLPAHPRIGRVAAEAHRRGHTDAGALLAALIQERDVRLSSRTRFDGARRREGDEVASSDLLLRMDQLESVGARASFGQLRRAGLDGRSVKMVRAAADQFARALRKTDLAVTPSFDEEEALLLATLAGFPDRVAKRLSGRRLAITGGSVGELDEGSAVHDPLLVCVDADEWRGRVRVRRASQVTLEHLMELFLDRLEDVSETRFDASRGRITATAQVRFDGLVVEESPGTVDPARGAEVLARAAVEAGVSRFCDADALSTLRQRVAFAAQVDDRLPTLDDAWMESLLTRLCVGKSSFAELRDAGLLDWVRAELGAMRTVVDRLAPEHVSLPGRAKVPVVYEAGRPPHIASRLQDFFGITDGPTVGGAPVVLHLLDPRGRAVQVTTDLAGFWDRHYDDVRKELRRRYAKHHWPDDPRTAEAKRHGRRRKRK